MKVLDLVKKVLFAAVQLTWGLPQTLCGFIVFLTEKGNVSGYRCAIHKKWRREEGLSLGLFLFTSSKATERIKAHEYGHSIQSMILGPFYLPVIGLPSLLWCRWPGAEKYRCRKQKDYYSFYTEKTADRLGKAKKREQKDEMEEIHDPHNC